jgi:cytochrome P450
MPVSTEVPSQASWSQDLPGSAHPPVPEPPYFDPTLDAWVFSRYGDITAALRHPSLVPAPLRSRKLPSTLTEEEHRRMRSETQEALSPVRLRSWKEQLLQRSEDLSRSIPSNRPVDLLAEYARPLCLSFASTVTGLQQENALKLCEHARAVSMTAADPYSLPLKEASRSADAELKLHFHTGPESLRDPGFVGLSQTLPAMLGNIWFVLLQHPEVWRHIHQEPEGIDRAIEELLRHAGFTRILTRAATTDLTLDGTSIRKGQCVILRLSTANHDPEFFEDPHQIDLARRGPTQLSFGAGLHSCVGAGLLRAASAAITLPLFSQFVSARLVRDIEWQGGAIFRFPRALWVSLDR